MQEPTCWPPDVTVRQPLPVLWALVVDGPPPAGSPRGEEQTADDALAYANRKRAGQGLPAFASFAELRAHYGLEDAR